MINKKIFSKITGVIVTITMLLTLALTTSAEVSKEPLVLTKGEAINMALKSNNDILRIDALMNNLSRQFEKYKKLSNEVTQLLDDFEDYKDDYKEINSEEFKENRDKISEALGEHNNLLLELNKLQEELAGYEKDSDEYKEVESKIISTENKLKSLNVEELNHENDKINSKLTAFEKERIKFISMGLASPTEGSPINLSAEDEYSRFIVLRDIAWYTVQNNIQKVKYQKELAKSSIEVGVNLTFDNILFADEMLNLKRQLYEKQEKDYNNTVIQYENDQISQIEKVTAEKELEKLSLEVDNLNRQIENGKIQLKQLLGLDLEQEIVLKSDIDTSIKELADYDKYLFAGLLKRNEIISAKLDYEEKERTLKIISEYLDYKNYEWLEADEAFNKASIALEEAKKDVKGDIERAYLETRHKKLEIELYEKKLQEAELQYNVTKKSYDMGTVPLSVIWSVEIGVSNARINYNNAIRDYKAALNKLEVASTIGSKY